ncbi:glycosyltransferase family 2 protein [candidate division FCPU426 bacterium]|nr:glycosyltransferase family 2 protein [candidate division FCPU426 bacterium]
MKEHITVIMCAYNEETGIRQAVDSILAQTFQDFTLIVVLDPSRDRTLEIIRSYDDARIMLIANSKRAEVAQSRNQGIQAAQGKYIALLDADDIAYPRRLAVQKQYLDDHPEIDVCGSWAHLEHKGVIQEIKYPVDPESFKKSLTWYLPIIHPSVMGKTRVFKDNLYRFNRAEDHEFFLRISRHYAIGNVPDFLILYRRKKPLMNEWWGLRVRVYGVFKYGLPLYTLLVPLLHLILPSRIRKTLKRIRDKYILRIT